MKRDNAVTDHDKQLIRNSTAEFLIFTGQEGQQSIESRYEDKTVWLTKGFESDFDQVIKQLKQKDEDSE